MIQMPENVFRFRYRNEPAMKTPLDEHNFCCRCGNPVDAGQDHRVSPAKQPVARSSGNNPSRKGGFKNFLVVLFIAGAVLAFKREILQDMIQAGKHRSWVNPATQRVNQTRQPLLRPSSQSASNATLGEFARTRGR